MAWDDLVHRFDLGDDALFELLASETALGAAPQDRESRRALGRAWFDSHLSQIRDTVCGNAKIRQLGTGTNAALTTASAVADLLVSLFSGPAAFTVAVLVVRYGLHKLCGFPG
jgi:hypothetical protein